MHPSSADAQDYQGRRTEPPTGRPRGFALFFALTDWITPWIHQKTYPLLFTRCRRRPRVEPDPLLSWIMMNATPQSDLGGTSLRNSGASPLFFPLYFFRVMSVIGAYPLSRPLGSEIKRFFDESRGPPSRTAELNEPGPAHSVQHLDHPICKISSNLRNNYNTFANKLWATVRGPEEFYEICFIEPLSRLSSNCVQRWLSWKWTRLFRNQRFGLSLWLHWKVISMYQNTHFRVNLAETPTSLL